MLNYNPCKRLLTQISVLWGGGVMGSVSASTLDNRSQDFTTKLTLAVQQYRRAEEG